MPPARLSPISFPSSLLPQPEPSYHPKAVPSSDEGTQAIAGPVAESSLPEICVFFPSYTE